MRRQERPGGGARRWFLSSWSVGSDLPKPQSTCEPAPGRTVTKRDLSVIILSEIPPRVCKDSLGRGESSQAPTGTFSLFRRQRSGCEPQALPGKPQLRGVGGCQSDTEGTCGGKQSLGSGLGGRGRRDRERERHRHRERNRVREREGKREGKRKAEKEYAKGMLSRFSHVRLFATPWTIACQAHLFMGFSRREYWSVLPCTPPGDLPNPGIEPMSLMSPALAGGLFTSSATWEAHAKGASHSIAPVTPEIVPPSVSPSVCPCTGGLHPNHRNPCLLRKSHKPPLTPALSQDREPRTQRKLSRSFSILGPMRS